MAYPDDSTVDDPAKGVYRVNDEPGREEREEDEDDDEEMMDGEMRLDPHPTGNLTAISLDPPD